MTDYKKYDCVIYGNIKARSALAHSMLHSNVEFGTLAKTDRSDRKIRVDIKRLDTSVLKYDNLPPFVWIRHEGELMRCFRSSHENAILNYSSVYYIPHEDNVEFIYYTKVVHPEVVGIVPEHSRSLTEKLFGYSPSKVFQIAVSSGALLTNYHDMPRAIIQLMDEGMLEITEGRRAIRTILKYIAPTNADDLATALDVAWYCNDLDTQYRIWSNWEKRPRQLNAPFETPSNVWLDYSEPSEHERT